MFARRLPVYLIGGSMELSKRKTGVLLVALFTFSALAAAERPVRPSDPPLVNWRAPATYTPPPGARPLGIQSGPSILGPYPFFPVTPCRQYDSRNTSPLPQSTPRTVNLSGAPCGIPSSANAVSANITVFSITGATGNGVFNVGISSPPTSAWINYPPSETQRGNAGVLATDGSGNIVVEVNQGGGSVQFTVDVNGYYYNGNVLGGLMPTGDFFAIQGDVPSGGLLFAWNHEASGTNAYGLNAITESEGAGSAGVHGLAMGEGQTYGVFGTSSSTSFSAAGVHGEGNGNGQTIGVEGVCTPGPGTSLCTGLVGRGIGAGGYFTASGNGRIGVWALANGTSGTEYGVYGQESSTDADSAGILGVDATGRPAGATGFTTAGVRGESNSGVGVFAFSTNVAVAGYAPLAGAQLGSGTLGVLSFGDFEATGNKSFIEPHPTDASKVIRYVCLEGPESGTYFRGSAQVVHGTAVIDVPEDFRIVTDVEGLTVQLTPVGAPATMYVVSEDLNEIVVDSNRDVKFHYMVNGVRKAFKDHQAIAPGQEFMPRGPDEKMPAYLTEEAKRRLISNGTYNADGTVNMTTAERVGWTKIWADRKAEAEAAAAKNAAARSAAAHQGQQQ